MSFAVSDITSNQYGAANDVLPKLLTFPVAAGVTIYGQTMVGISAAGYAYPAGTAGTVQVPGRAYRQAVNTTAAGYGSAGQIRVDVEQGAFWFSVNADSTITIANYGQYVYASDDQTVSLYDGGGTRPLAGVIMPPGTQGANTFSVGQVAVLLGQSTPYFSAGQGAGGGTAFTARAVVISGHAYTGTTSGVLASTTNGTFASQFNVDGITAAVGNVIFIPEGLTMLTAATDAGPWVIQSLGGSSAKWVLNRPDWWATGNTWASGTEVRVGGEGQVYQNTLWRATAAAGVIDTTDPAFYVARLTFQAVLTSGTLALSAGQPNTFANYPLASGGTHTFPAGIYSASQSSILVTAAIAGGTQTTTVEYSAANHSSTALATAGPVGTAAAAVFALAAGQTTQTGDTSTVQVTLVNF